ncbi:conserved exported hypothetical protein [Thiomonas sp. X19]|uniref:hypothetical protein n=1 Tax=Thiomonas sp. X19 TaxID=1050370 RepID=UPI000B7402BD|nr:hypothetical protein [Thiomonas sp. X19]SCC91501.1 conserved exported hypothetical protein [Thiomonas sp. X19]
MLPLRRSLFACLGLVCFCRLAQAHVAPRPLFTGVGPDDVMRALPRTRDTQAALVSRSALHAPLAKAWALQLRGVVAVLQALDQGQVPHAKPGVGRPCGAAHWTDDSPSACAPLAASRHLLGVVLAGAQDFEKLRFPGVDGAYPAPATHAALQGASFIGSQGSRVLLVNLGATPIRVDLGHWVGAKPALHQAWLRASPASAKAGLERRVSKAARQPIVLPPESISVVG